MTPEEIDYGEKVKKKVAEELAQFLLLRDVKPEKVRIFVQYPETMAKIEIDIND